MSFEGRKKIVVFASGSGTNFEAIVKATKTGYINADVVLLISDKPSAYAIKRALNYGIPSVIINWRNRVEGESKADEILQRINPDVIALAGFMKILSPDFVKKWKFKILNIHPSILPAFQGTVNAVDLAYRYGVKITGCTVHFVDESVDGGPVIVQSAVPVSHKDTEDEIRRKIQKMEHKIYPWAIKKILEGKVKLDGRKVIIEDEGELEEFNPVVSPQSKNLFEDE